jgi:ubiquinone/menaquinone biosynthesis C-methylase UbiE
MQGKTEKVFISGEYLSRGEYHRNLDPNWSYYPIYIRKMAWVTNYIHKHIEKQASILDAGCGEGVLVEKLLSEGYKIKGIDYNYSSSYVDRGDITHLPYRAETFDVVTCLDVLEHLDFKSQKLAILELKRVLKFKGKAIFSIPNLAHLESRYYFLKSGQLKRTGGGVEKHPGDRPIGEYIDLLKSINFKIIEWTGIQITLPKRIQKILGKKFSTRIMYITNAPPSLCLINIIVCENI